MEKIGVFGIGQIGSAQLTLITGNGIPAVGIGTNESDLDRCRSKMEQNWDDLIGKGLATPENKAAAIALVTLSTDPAALADCTFVFEEVVENVDVKKAVYGKIEAVTPDTTIIASSTSSLDAEILKGCSGRPERLIIAHPFQPVHLQPLVEVVGNSETSEDTVVRTKAVLESLKRVVVVLKKSAPGFIVNRLAQTLFRESIYLVEQGVTTVEDIDKAIKYAVGMRYAEIGLLEYFDAVGYELEKAIAENVYPDLCSTSEIQKTVLDGIASGETGKNAGKGMYDWSTRSDEDYRRRLSLPYLPLVKDWNMPV